MRLFAGLSTALILLSACGSASPVNTATADDSAVSVTQDVSEQSSEEEGDDDAEEYFEDLPVDPYEPPPPGFILEPANAQMEALDGWVDVDEWYWEPISVAQSPDCAGLNDVMLLEDWGVITSFRLRDGTELYHFTADLNTAENVADYVAAFNSLPSTCASATFEGAELTFAPFQSGALDGLTMTANGQVSPNWLFESDTVSSAVIASRNNVVSILQVVPADDFDMAEFEDLTRLAVERLDRVPPETSGSPDAEPEAETG